MSVAYLHSVNISCLSLLCDLQRKHKLCDTFRSADQEALITWCSMQTLSILLSQGCSVCVLCNLFFCIERNGPLTGGGLQANLLYRVLELCFARERITDLHSAY